MRDRGRCDSNEFENANVGTGELTVARRGEIELEAERLGIMVECLGSRVAIVLEERGGGGGGGDNIYG